jgi:DNA-binding response OmpR family regulator
MDRILLIDDDPLTLETWAYMLRDAGYDVATAASGRLGLEVLGERPCDLVIADLLLGDMTALDLLDQVHAARLCVPVIVATGFASIQTAVAATRRGAVNYVVKPLIGEDLIQQVELGLAASPQRQDAVAPHDHAAARWARTVVGLLSSRYDARTLGQWARSVGTSTSALRSLCYASDLSPKRSLTLARLLRAVYLSREIAWSPTQRLDVTDPRTLRRMLIDGGLVDVKERVTVREFVVKQSLVTDRGAIAALRDALRSADPSIELD